jgi:asparagine synthase (glutamine-hydrolysing)
LSADHAASSSGIYGLFRLDGGPVDDGDLHQLGLTSPEQQTSAVAMGRDVNMASAVHRHDDDGYITLLVGQIGDAPDLATKLGLAAHTPLAKLGSAVLSKFGADTPSQMIGEWSLLHWQPDGRLTLMMSAGCRDRIMYAKHGPKIAVAANIFALVGLPWVGNAIDETSFLRQLGRADLRATLGSGTLYRNIRRVEPGTTVVLDSRGESITKCHSVFPEPSEWSGTFDDAAEEANSLLRHILQERLAHTPHPVGMLSGGLDSSLLAAFGSETVGTAKPLSFVTSVAPPQSGLADEAKFARMVADHLGRPIYDVFPASEATIYRPPEHILGGASGPPLSNRHVLTEALQRAAQQCGGTSMLDGTFGELSLTARLAPPTPRQRLGRLLRLMQIRTSPAAQRQESNIFHVRIAPHRLAQLPGALRVSTGDFFPTDASKSRRHVGYFPWAEKALANSTEFYPGALRADFPFRDIRLLRFFARLPLSLLQQQPGDRALGRRMLVGRLPDEIRLRRLGMPASPDHILRLQSQAEAARGRIAVFRRAGVDDWLDLDWLDQSLARISANGLQNSDDANQIQLTAITAEFLTWLLLGGV